MAVFWDVTPCSLVEAHRHLRYLCLPSLRRSVTWLSDDRGSKHIRNVCQILRHYAAQCPWRL